MFVPDFNWPSFSKYSITNALHVMNEVDQHTRMFMSAEIQY